jgi:predicted CopG family antitoxin
MPQITVTISDDVYWDLMNLPKGLKSKFVNNALDSIISWKCQGDSSAMYAFAKGYPHEIFTKKGGEEE